MGSNMAVVVLTADITGLGDVLRADCRKLRGSKWALISPITLGISMDARKVPKQIHLKLILI